MDRLSGLAADRLDNSRMRIAERIDGDSTEEIEIFAAALIVEIAAFAADEDDQEAAGRYSLSGALRRAAPALRSLLTSCAS